MTALVEAVPERGFRHEAAVYRGDRGFLDVTVDYVREGLAIGAAVVVAVVPPRIELLRSALGPAAERVRFVNMARSGRNPARVIPMWREMIEPGSGVPVRGIGEPVWHGRRPAELVEALLHEALLNLAFADAPDLLLRCPYDAEALGEEIVSHANRRHPTVVDRHGQHRGLGYHDAVQAAAEFTVPLLDTGAEWQPEAYEFGDMPTVRRLRAMVGERAGELGIDEDRGADLALSVHEIAVNSLRHGGGSGTLRLWFDGVALVCEVADRGHIDQPLVGRMRP